MCTYATVQDLTDTFRGAGYQTVTSFLSDGWRIRIGAGHGPELSDHRFADSIVVRANDDIEVHDGDTPVLRLGSLKDIAGRDIITAYHETAVFGAH